MAALLTSRDKRGSFGAWKLGKTLVLLAPWFLAANGCLGVNVPGDRCPGPIAAVTNASGSDVTFEYTAPSGASVRQTLPPGVRSALPDLPPGAPTYSYTATRSTDSALLAQGQFGLSCDSAPVSLLAFDPASPRDVYPAPRSALPSLVSAGGAVMTHPVFYPATYSDDPLRGDIQAFVTRIGTDPFWAVPEQYGAGAGRLGATLGLPGQAPSSLDDRDIQNLLVGTLIPQSGVTPGINTLFAVFIPQSTTVTAQALGASCRDFWGYHSAVWYSDLSGYVPYVVIARCPAPSSSDADLLNMVTATTSHELAEAATDPVLSAYLTVDAAHDLWASIDWGAETGDLCENRDDALYDSPTLGYRVQRLWSDQAATAGHDPCVAAIAAQDPYFYAVPVLGERIGYSDPSRGGNAAMSEGLTIPVGSSRTLELRLYSDAPSAEWQVHAEELDTSGNLSFSLSADSGSNGDVILLDIQARGQDPAYGAEPFAIRSTLGGHTVSYYGLVGNGAGSAPSRGAQGSAPAYRMSWETPGAALAWAAPAPDSVRAAPLKAMAPPRRP